MSDGVNLGSVTTTGDADSDVDTLCYTQSVTYVLLYPTSFLCFGSQIPILRRTELVETENKDWLVDLEAEDLWLNERERAPVDLDEALASLAVGDSGRSLLLAEALHTLGS